MKLQIPLSLYIFIASIVLISCNKQYTKTENGFKTEINSTITEFQFYSPEIVRVVKSKKGFDFEKNSLSVIKVPQTVSFSLMKTDSAIVATTEKMVVKQNIYTGTVSFYSDKGESRWYEIYTQRRFG